MCVIDYIDFMTISSVGPAAIAGAIFLREMRLLSQVSSYVFRFIFFLAISVECSYILMVYICKL